MTEEAVKINYQSARELLKTKPVKPNTSKKRATLYIDHEIYACFQKLCIKKELSVSALVQAMMVDVLTENK